MQAALVKTEKTHSPPKKSKTNDTYLSYVPHTNKHSLAKKLFSDRSTQTTNHSRPQRPRSFWSAPRIATSGRVQQRFTDFPSLCACSKSSLTNLIGSGLDLLCSQIQSKPECRWTWPEVAILRADRKD